MYISKKPNEYLLVPMDFVMNPNMSLEAFGAALVLMDVLESIGSLPMQEKELAKIWNVSEKKARDLFEEINMSGHDIFKITPT